MKLDSWIVTLQTSRRLTIPLAIREKLGLNIGDKVNITMECKGISITKFDERYIEDYSYIGYIRKICRGGRIVIPKIYFELNKLSCYSEVLFTLEGEKIVISTKVMKSDLGIKKLSTDDRHTLSADIQKKLDLDTVKKSKIVRLKKDGRLIIPVDIQRNLGLYMGDNVNIVMCYGKIIITKEIEYIGYIGYIRKICIGGRIVIPKEYLEINSFPSKVLFTFKGEKIVISKN